MASTQAPNSCETHSSPQHPTSSPEPALVDQQTTAATERTATLNFLEEVKQLQELMAAKDQIGTIDHNKRVDEIAAYTNLVQRDPKNVLAWTVLGRFLAPTARHRLTINKERVFVTRQDCYVKALECHGRSAISWMNLASTLTGTKTALVGGVAYNRDQCYIRAVELDPSTADAWLALGKSVVSDAFVIKGIDAPVTRIQCFVNALNDQVLMVDAWEHLARALKHEDDTAKSVDPEKQPMKVWVEKINREVDAEYCAAKAVAIEKTKNSPKKVAKPDPKPDPMQRFNELIHRRPDAAPQRQTELESSDSETQGSALTSSNAIGKAASSRKASKVTPASASEKEQLMADMLKNELVEARGPFPRRTRVRVA